MRPDDILTAPVKTLTVFRSKPKKYNYPTDVNRPQKFVHLGREFKSYANRYRSPGVDLKASTPTSRKADRKNTAKRLKKQLRHTSICGQRKFIAQGLGLKKDTPKYLAMIFGGSVPF